MLPSQTVENYLKTIYLAHAALAPRGVNPGHQGEDEFDPATALVPMGQIAAALGVVPGTATSMVKALAESGLAHYEPYMGARLTPAGEALASRVLRRHRLIELFLVKVLGMSWTEVHDEAEQLEHAVSDALVERIDQMLGRPSVDPHGDPIPTAEGTMAQPERLDLLTAPLDTSLTVTRVLDQDAVFLRFAESSGLTPGSHVTIRGRDRGADAVRLESTAGSPVTIGTPAAAKILVRKDF